MAKHPGGRPTKYKKEYVDRALKAFKKGTTDDLFSVSIGIRRETFYQWLDRYPEFSNAVKEGKAYLDAKVEKSLFQRAMGYKQKAVKIFNDNGRPLIVDYIEKFPPDPTSMIFWLKNRMPKEWRDKTQVEFPDKDGNPQNIALLDNLQLAAKLAWVMEQLRIRTEAQKQIEGPKEDHD